MATVSLATKKIPEIESLNPPVGSPGDIIVIHGSHFGNKQGAGFIEIANERLTSTCYLSWSDSEIKLILPSNVQDGLVIVDRDGRRSKPTIFANKATIPIAVPPNPKTSYPVIDSLSTDTISSGQLLILTGTNFGDVRGKSCVFFRTDHTNLSNTDMPISRDTQDSADLQNNYISAHSNDYDYEYWSDTEIRVRVPDGAASGYIYVKTEKGNSALQKLNVNTNYGVKKFSSGRTYIIQLTVNISDAKAAPNSSLTLHIPRPIVTASQPVIEMTECNPEPVMTDYRNTVIQQTNFNEFENRKKKFSQNFRVSVYSISTSVNENKIEPFTDKTRLLYTTSIQADACVPSNSDKIKKLSMDIVKKERNPYRQAHMVYTYLLDNYQLLTNVRTGNISVLNTLDTHKGDAYDFAILYTALLRALKIPARPISGILVDATLKTKNHWWSEFYLENFGWVPVDPALGAGLAYKPFRTIEDPKTFYFGNLDSQHITFSVGWNTIKPSLVNNKIIYRPRTYALQSIWEEASAGADQYSSFWSDPVILGVY